MHHPLYRSKRIQKQYESASFKKRLLGSGPAITDINQPLSGNNRAKDTSSSFSIGTQKVYTSKSAAFGVGNDDSFGTNTASQSETTTESEKKVIFGKGARPFLSNQHESQPFFLSSSLKSKRDYDRRYQGDGQYRGDDYAKDVDTDAISLGVKQPRLKDYHEAMEEMYGGIDLQEHMHELDTHPTRAVQFADDADIILNNDHTVSAEPIAEPSAVPSPAADVHPAYITDNNSATTDAVAAVPVPSIPPKGEVKVKKATKQSSVVRSYPLRSAWGLQSSKRGVPQRRLKKFLAVRHAPAPPSQPQPQARAFARGSQTTRPSRAGQYATYNTDAVATTTQARASLSSSSCFSSTPRSSVRFGRQAVKASVSRRAYQQYLAKKQATRANQAAVREQEQKRKKEVQQRLLSSTFRLAKAKHTRTRHANRCTEPSIHPRNKNTIRHTSKNKNTRYTLPDLTGMDVYGPYSTTTSSTFNMTLHHIHQQQQYEREEEAWQNQNQQSYYVREANAVSRDDARQKAFSVSMPGSHTAR